MMKVAIHTVFIAKENIPFLEEWIQYHYNVGVDCFMLYDNTGVQDFDPWDSKHGKLRGMLPNKINKRGIDFSARVKFTNEQVTERLEQIRTKFPDGVVNYIPWQERNTQGLIQYFQKEAALDNYKRIKKMNIDWCVSIDTDEFLTFGKGVTIQDQNETTIKKYLEKLHSSITSIKLPEQRHPYRWELIPDEFTIACDCPDVYTSAIGMKTPQVRRDLPGKSIYKVTDKTPLYRSAHNITNCTGIKQTTVASRRWKIYIKHFCL